MINFKAKIYCQMGTDLFARRKSYIETGEIFLDGGLLTICFHLQNIMKLA